MTGLRTLPDKELSTVFHYEARRYTIAADTLADRSSLDLTHPCYFLRCHAIRAFVESHSPGYRLNPCRGGSLWPRLLRAFEDAKKRGLIVCEVTFHTVQTLSGLHRRHQFRYRKRA